MSKTIADQAELKHLIERMVASRVAMNVHRDELSELRRQARAEGLNTQALNALVDLLGENTPDRGARAVGDLLTYAEIAGTELETRLVGAGDGSERTPAPPASSDAPNGEAASSAVVEPQKPVHTFDWAPLGKFVSAALALSISAGLLWLLN